MIIIHTANGFDFTYTNIRKAVMALGNRTIKAQAVRNGVTEIWL